MDAKSMAWLSYLTPVGWIIAFVNYSNSLIKPSLTTFHLRQSLGLMAIYFAAWFAGTLLAFTLPVLAIIFYLCIIIFFVLSLIGLINATKGEEKMLPVVGPLFQQWFTFIK